MAADSGHPEMYVYRGITFDTGLVGRESLPDLERFNVRHDDVFLASFPRSGTHWLTEMVLLLMADGDTSKVNRITMDQILEMTLHIDTAKQPIAGYKVFEEWPRDRPRVMLTHLCAEFLPQQLSQKKGAKVIYIARNVLDVLTSQHGLLSATNMLHPQLQDWPKFVEHNMTDEVSGGSWFHHVSGYWTRRESNDNLLLLKFEDIKQNHRKIVQEIAKFLERPLTTGQIDCVVELTSFEGMKKTYERIETADPSKIFRTRAFGVEPFLKRGEVGNWKGKYSDEQRKKLNSKIEEELGSLGLSFQFEI